MIKKHLKSYIVKNVPDNEIALLLSGGVDSQSVALAAHDVGKTVIAYSFHLDGDESYDYLKAKEVSQYMGWKFKGIDL